MDLADYFPDTCSTSLLALLWTIFTRRLLPENAPSYCSVDHRPVHLDYVYAHRLGAIRSIRFETAANPSLPHTSVTYASTVSKDTTAYTASRNRIRYAMTDGT